MADDRQILQGVRVKDRIITDVDELEKAAAEKESGIDMQHLMDSGAISGSFKGVKPAKEAKETKK